MKNMAAKTGILAINGGSSSVKFALFDATNSMRRVLEGEIERIGLPWHVRPDNAMEVLPQ